MSDVWKQLEAMRQHLKPHIRITEEVLRAMLDQHKTVTNERDALAAHVEALRKSGNRAICYGGNESSDDWHEVVSQSPTTSLARRDLIKQAEALEYMANEFDEQGEYRGYASQLEQRAADLRRQAQEL